MKKLQLLPFLLLTLYALSCQAQESFPNLYNPYHITQIQLKFVEEDWQYPMHYLHSLGNGDRHMGNAKVNGVRFDSVGVRFKGFSSYKQKMQKNPLNIKLDYRVKKADYQGYETLKLASGNLDPSWIREVLAYEIARKYMVAPQSNYAQVYVNGAYYGLFGSTEDVDWKFGERYLGSDKNSVVVKGNSPLGPFAGKRSSLEYWGDDPSEYEKGYELDNGESWEPLMKLTKTLKLHPENIEFVLDMDAAIWMLAFNNVLLNLDSYNDFQQNFYLIQDATKRFHFVLWDLNLAFDGLGKPNNLTMQPDYDPLSKLNDERYPLINLVLKNPTYRKIYFAHCRTILKENFANGWYKSEAQKLHDLVADAVRQDTNWVYDIEAFEQNLHDTYTAMTPAPFPYPGITELMDARTAFLQSHKDYKKLPPAISGIAANAAEDGQKVLVTATVRNCNKAWVAWRNSNGNRFEKSPMFDDGQHADGQPKDGVYGVELPAGNNPIQYYIYAENAEAVMFAPERAEHEIFSFP
ncbi:MAG: hypothetical protein GC192_24610 [Bacteroidetes bacterium]|nr:hypothetical protein [Bacteroidota bacterium]